MNPSIDSQPSHPSPFLLLLSIPLAVYVVFQCLIPTMEPTYFWGELLVLCLFPLIFRISSRTKHESGLTKCLLIWIFFFPVYGLVMTHLFWPQAVFYFMMRHLAYFYYAIFFFGGYCLGKATLDFWGRLWLPLVLTFIGFYLIKHHAGVAHSLVLGFIWAACLRAHNNRLVFWLGLLVIVAFHLVGMTRGERGTDKVILASLPIPFLLRYLKGWVFYEPRSRLFYTLFKFSLPILIIGGVWATIIFTDMRHQMMSAGRHLSDLSGRFGTRDSGYMWRFFLWTYLLERFYRHPLGIGLGTPLFEDKLRSFMLFPPEAEEPFVMGGHNFAVTLTARLGVVFLAILPFMARNTFGLIYNFLKKTDMHVTKTPESRLVYASLVGFMISFIQASFNVVLETPIFAGVAWFLFGLFVRLCGDYVAEDAPPLSLPKTDRSQP